MKKIISVLSLILVFCMTSSLFCYASSPEPAEIDDFQRELCEVFPDQVSIILGEEKTVSLLSDEERTVAERYEAVTDEHKEYHLTVYNDGSYTASLFSSGQIIGGTSSSGSGYSSIKGATLRISNYLGANDNLSVSINPISFTFVNGGYDYISEAASSGAATVLLDDVGGQTVVPYACVRDQYVRSESASGPAYASYAIGLVPSQPSYRVDFRVGGEKYTILLNGAVI